MAQKVAEYVVERVLAEMDKGVVPWHKPWRVGGDRNIVSKKGYQGINTLLLMIEREKHGYKSDWWMTFNQAKGLGGSVRSGAKSAMVVYWKVGEMKDDKAESGKRKTFLLRYYNVFNADSVDGVKVPVEVTREHTPVVEAEMVFRTYLDYSKVGLGHGGDRAYYAPVDDKIQLPMPEAFHTVTDYYGAAFHEAVHSTGHTSRLKRFTVNEYDVKNYAREELVAEIGAAMLRTTTGVETDKALAQSAAYLKTWRDRISEDHNLIITAASRAEKAYHLIMQDQDAAAESTE